MDSTLLASIIGAVAAIAAAALPYYLNSRKKSVPIESSSYAHSSAKEVTTKRLKTWAGQSEFSYSGTVKDGTKIIIGDTKQVSEVTAEQYKKLIKKFSGKTIKVGAVQSSNYEPGTLDEWLKQNVTKRMIATYVASILKHESYATNTQGKIEFN